VVIIVKENHSFDNYFGTFPAQMAQSFRQRKTRRRAATHRTNHAAWLERATHAAKEQYGEKDIPAYFRLRDNSPVRQLLHGSGQPVRTEPSDAYRGGSPIIDNANKNRTYQPQEPFKTPTLPKALENAKLTGPRTATRGSVTSRNRGAERQQEYSAVDKIRHGRGGREIAERVVGCTRRAVPWSFPSTRPSEKRRQKTVKLGSQWTADRVRKLGQSKLGRTR